MNRKGIWALFAVSLLLVPLAASVHAVKADNVNPTSYSVVEILFPANATYNSRFLALNVTFPCSAVRYTLTYNIDGKDGGSIPWTVENPEEVHVVYKAIGSVALPKLSEGSHCVTATIVCGLYGYGGANPPGAPFKETTPGSSNYTATWTDTVYFTIDSGAGTTEPAPPADSVPPVISNISVDNMTYTSTEIPLNFTVNENITSAAYSLDGEDNVTISGNTTLTGLAAGTHNLTVYAWDTAGNIGASQTVNFTVTNETSTAVVVTASAASAVVVAIVVMGYFKKHRK